MGNYQYHPKYFYYSLVAGGITYGAFAIYRDVSAAVGWNEEVVGWCIVAAAIMTCGYLLYDARRNLLPSHNPDEQKGVPPSKSE